MASNEYGNCDAKMLILKRWDMGQTKQLFEHTYSQNEYISFQGYHFIEILPAKNSGNLFELYKNTQHARDTRVDDDIHTVQSMTIVSNHTNDAFWELPVHRLGITFLQLADSTEWHYDRIYNKLQTLFEDKEQWALYYSLDFCDLVLFTKDVEFNHFNDILWKSALVRDGDLKAICDTFSILCFSSSYLKDCFEYIDVQISARKAEGAFEKAQRIVAEALSSNVHISGLFPGVREIGRLEEKCRLALHALERAKKKARSAQSPIAWEDRISLSVNLSIKNVTALFNLLSRLSEMDIQYAEHRLPGRYDVNLFIENIDGNQAITVLYLIDQQAKPGKGSAKSVPIGNYEVIFMASKWSGKKRVSFIPQSKQSFENAISCELNRMVSDFPPTSADLHGYIYETLRAIRELSNTGFSEEFILSVYPPTIAFIKMLKEINLFAQSDFSARLLESTHFISRNFFTALNTLSACTMHSERQFIHAPAFNASYFEIPPKLLAFYNAFVYYLSTAISSSPLYCYMITPDFRSDINVQPLHIAYEEDTVCHLAIIHLPERYFFDPRSAVMLLSHEVGHYEGDRKRGLRAKSIFEMVSMTLLIDSGLFPCEVCTEGYATDTSLLGVLSNALGEFLLSKFHFIIDAPNRGISDHLSDISDFIRACDFGYQFFREDDSRREIEYRWKSVLHRVSYTDPEQLEATRFILEKFDEQEGTSFFSQLANIDTISSTYDSVAQFLAEKICNISITAEQKRLDGIAEHCEMIIQAFSEAFADMQMVRTMGKTFSLQRYRELIFETRHINNAMQETRQYEPTAEQVVRYNAVCNVFGMPVTDSLYQAAHLPTNTIIHKVTEYLRCCLTSHQNNLDSIISLETFLEANSFLQCRTISDILKQYKDLLTVVYSCN